MIIICAFLFSFCVSKNQAALKSGTDTGFPESGAVDTTASKSLPISLDGIQEVACDSLVGFVQDEFVPYVVHYFEPNPAKENISPFSDTVVYAKNGYVYYKGRGKIISILLVNEDARILAKYIDLDGKDNKEILVNINFME